MNGEDIYASRLNDAIEELLSSIEFLEKLGKRTYIDRGFQRVRADLINDVFEKAEALREIAA